MIITSYGFRLAYFDPGLSRRSICCVLVNTESRFSIFFTYRNLTIYTVVRANSF